MDVKLELTLLISL